MLGIIITIIIVLHLIMFGFLYYLHTQLQAYKKSHVKDLTTLMDTYLDEIKIENNRLENELKRTTVSSIHQVEDPLEEGTNGLAERQDNIVNQVYEGTLMEKFSEIEKVPKPSIEAQVLQLHAKGMRSTDIAKTLQCGKTEVELIINFHAQK